MARLVYRAILRNIGIFGILLFLVSVFVILNSSSNSIENTQFAKSHQSALPDYGRKENLKVPGLTNEITVVSAYFQLAPFKKGSREHRNISHYIHWMENFKHFTNPLVFYSDSSQIIRLMRSLRKERPNTAIYHVDKTNLWSFQIVDKIKKIFDDPNYPKHPPNTVIPEYSCIQHAKYDVLNFTQYKNPYRTKYFAWIDVGYFRHIKQQPFQLVLPDNYNESRISFAKITSNKETEPELIFKNTIFWVGGGLVLGSADVIHKFYIQYRNAVDVFLSHGWMNSDQQVIYAMYTQKGKQMVETLVDIQLHKKPVGCTTCGRDRWFHLGRSMIRYYNER